ncbi:uncharacterized protein LOC128961372 [Oppia nitens]|uniref:uncharacterized protein LOC128961372 n=1 Tax=Oppia nitens TaxID=1686743 RepID=UPI0023DBFBEE|nr:uncharacterized protein LOC128961372 [Oppia nitens]
MSMPTVDDRIGTESERGRDFYPQDTTGQSLESVDWKSRYQELRDGRSEWDTPEKFCGMKRLGDSYHPVEAFFKITGLPSDHHKFDRVWYPLVASVIGFGGAVYTNVQKQRPFWSAIPRTVAAVGLFYAIGEYLWRSSRRRARERDAVLVHYLLVHEQDFPRIERKKFGQIVKPWYPWRQGIDGKFVHKEMPQ